ncbi:hypothetical protein GCM10011505_25200 [Tistrella bauzanensis]|uniref:YCII-related domain-containing protein n=1 Tax=Tistrella bauzanensis TaxID=657419 RepID=A0ABQ1IKP1_9PROT|nr:YciI family protein [Tistrella bauzanensis]GGB42769.1 hypothetical protein GCM10011505_25200 [Tistrella bauzanensis]
MLYAILCYDREDVVAAWSPVQEQGTMARLAAVEDGLAAQGRLGPVARLMPTARAVTVTKGDAPLVIDGPFAETREQLLGFFVVDCASVDEAVTTARDLARANADGAGVYEIRPLALFRPGVAAGVTDGLSDTTPSPAG